MSKTGISEYTFSVITDTHGYPLSSKEANFDLGDNTESDDLFTLEPIDTTQADIIIYGNHDVAKLGNNAYKGLTTKAYYTPQIMVYGLDSCKSVNTFEIPNDLANNNDQIMQIAEHLLTLGANWDVIVLTHVPLFDSNTPQFQPYTCWAGNTVQNADTLLQILKAYHTHTSYTYRNKTYDYSNKTGYVIGCFSGHTHCSIKCSKNGIYMESLVANGGTTFTKTAKIKDGGLYSTNLHPAQIHITFNSNPALNKVNGEFYVNPIEQYTVDDTPPSNYYGPEAKGWLKFKSNDSAYPKFYPDSGFNNGIYLGWAGSASAGSLYNEFAGWGTDDNTVLRIESGTNVQTITVDGVKFGANGLLKYYSYNSNTWLEIPNNNANISFTSNNVKWRFVNGKYQFDKSKNYKLKTSSNAYPVFDADGRYLGWAYSPNAIMEGVRDSSTSSRSFSLVDTGTTRLYVDKTHVAAVINIIFNANGILTSFERNNGTYYTNVSGLVEIIGGSAKWTFNNGLLTSIEAGGKIWAYYNCSNQLMKFTNTQYYMYFTNGYLTGYRYMSDPASTIRNDDIDTNWTCRKEVKYYANEVDAYYNRNVQYSFTTPFLTFTSTDNTNHYISNLNNSYSYARIDNGSDKYYFKKISTNKWILIDIYGG